MHIQVVVEVGHNFNCGAREELVEAGAIKLVLLPEVHVVVPRLLETWVNGLGVRACRHEREARSEHRLVDVRDRKIHFGAAGEVDVEELCCGNLDGMKFPDGFTDEFSVFHPREGSLSAHSPRDNSLLFHVAVVGWS